MRNKMLKIAGLTAAAAVMLSMTAFADTRITNVSIRSSAEDADMEPGVLVAPYFYSNSDMYEVTYNDETTTTTSNSPKRERTYEIRLDANQGYYFPKENQVNVSVDGVNSISRKDTEDETTFIIRVRAYPYYQWPEVTGIEGVDNTSTKITWEDGDADKWEYVLQYVDTYGEERVKHGTTTRASLDVKTYNKEYTGSNEDRQDSEVVGFAVRAVGNAGSNNRVADGVWTSIGNVDYSEYDEGYTTWYDALGNVSSGTQVSGSTGSSHGSSTPVVTSPQLPSYVVRGTWTDHGNGLWSFTDVNGKRYVNEWAAVDNSQYANTSLGQQPFDWFYFDGSGYMYTGWLENPAGSGDWYYLQTESNGTRGAMYTGWHTINGKNYHFNENSDGYRGRCTNPYQ